MSEKFLSHVNIKRDFTKYLSCKIAQVLSAAGKDILLPTALLLNQTLSIFQTNWSFIHVRKLILWLYYNELMLPKVIHFVNYACHVQTQMCFSCFCTFTRRYVIILYFTPSYERLMLKVTTAIKLFLLLILLSVQHLTNSHVCWMHVKIDGYVKIDG